MYHNFRHSRTAVQPVHPIRLQGWTSIHGLSGTEDAQTSPFGCISLEKVNRFMLHVAAYAMHSQLLGSDGSRSLPCLASQEARVDVDAKAGLAQIACRRRRAGALDPKVGVAT